MPEHARRVCQRLKSLRYHTRSHSDAFQCPECGRQGRFNLNWLGNRKGVFCVGLRFERDYFKAGERQLQYRLEGI
jgi:hypothetical protein